MVKRGNKNNRQAGRAPGNGRGVQVDAQHAASNEPEDLHGEENWFYKDIARDGGGRCWLERAG
jgi:hypothetical protein